MSHIVISKHLEERSRLLPYLTDFYAKRAVDGDCILTLQDMQYRAILESQGAQFIDIYAPEAQATKLELYQQEMRDFIRFLKDSYFGTSS